MDPFASAGMQSYSSGGTSSSSTDPYTAMYGIAGAGPEDAEFVAAMYGKNQQAGHAQHAGAGTGRGGGQHTKGDSPRTKMNSATSVPPEYQQSPLQPAATGQLQTAQSVQYHAGLAYEDKALTHAGALMRGHKPLSLVPGMMTA